MDQRIAAGFFPPGADPVSELWLACLVDLEIYEQAEALRLVEWVIQAKKCRPVPDRSAMSRPRSV